jgi:hypothetical protein
MKNMKPTISWIITLLAFFAISHTASAHPDCLSLKICWRTA